MALPIEYTSDPVIAAVESPQKTFRKARQHNYPIRVWYILACFIFLVSIINWVGFAITYFRARRQRRRLAQTSSTNLSHSLKTRGSIDLLRLPLALIDTFRALSFRWTIPIGPSYSLNIMQVLLSAAYIAILFSWALINGDIPKIPSGGPRDWANVTGRVAAIQFPLIVGLGMKNNIISFLTGVSFEKLNYLHRMATRVVMVLIWLHLGTWASLGLVGDKAITHPDVRAGVLAAVALTLLGIVWIRPIRRRAYELFLFTHLLLAVILLISAYFHTARRNSAEVIWPAMLLWALDRVIRACRLAISFITGKRTSTTESLPESTPKILSSPKIELLPGNLIRLTTPAPKFFHWRPGQSVYLTLPKISNTYLEGHPFTISTIDRNLSSQKPELKFLIQGRKGFTRRLYNSDGTNTIGTVLVDGPYSTPPRLVGYDSVLLIAGGSGVTFVLPLLLDLLERSKCEGIACRRLTFVWSIRHLEHIVWIQDDLLDALKDIPPNLTLDIHIFVTNKAPTVQNDIEEDPEKLNDDAASNIEKESISGGDAGNYEKDQVYKHLLSLSMIQIHQGRADLATFIKNEIAQAQDRMSVNVCGSEMLSRAVRQSIRNPRMVDILRGGPTISLYVESFQNN